MSARSHYTVRNMLHTVGEVNCLMFSEHSNGCSLDKMLVKTHAPEGWGTWSETVWKTWAGGGNI